MDKDKVMNWAVVIGGIVLMVVTIVGAVVGEVSVWLAVLICGILGLCVYNSGDYLSHME